METKELIAKYEPQMIADRRHLHENPETSHNEFETTEFIKKALTECGVEVAEIGLKTGVVGILRGNEPGKTVGIRADIDALPMGELTGLPFASKKEGICHSCGHDMHTSILLCCARVLSEIRSELKGNVMFLFQPAEETASGAKEMIACDFTKVLKPDCYISLHTAPALTAGMIGVKSGPAGASADAFKIIIRGKGGHGAHPEKFVDPVMTAAYVLTQLQAIVARENHPILPGVLTIGSIHGGTAPNIVPDSVEMGGTLRTLDAEVRTSMQKAVDRIVTCGCEAMRATGEVIWNYGIPPQINSEEVTNRIEAAAVKVIGADHIIHGKYPSMGSEDFSCMSELAPAAQFSFGTGNDENPDTRRGLHDGRTQFDEKGMLTGAGVIVQYVRDYLQ